MTPPKAPVAGEIASAAAPSAVSVCLQVIQKRRDFLLAAKARRAVCPGFVLQARKRRDDEAPDGIRIGYTCSKKVGNAVARNRAKRRLREVARQVLPALGRDGWDYVLIGRANVTAARPFDALLDDLKDALQKIHPKPS
jgi:ribonuclease P protein component